MVQLQRAVIDPCSLARKPPLQGMQNRHKHAHTHNSPTQSTYTRSSEETLFTPKQCLLLKVQKTAFMLITGKKGAEHTMVKVKTKATPRPEPMQKNSTKMRPLLYSGTWWFRVGCIYERLILNGGKTRRRA